jgi:hypothetical protein
MMSHKDSERNQGRSKVELNTEENADPSNWSKISLRLKTSSQLYCTCKGKMTKVERKTLFSEEGSSI